ncbi:hypothetical protein CP982_26820 [Streptomyces spectabilis]|uniref:Uncharacterized protein n=1 Tax=Streptomyces spectabilis TaxID=68270 RepID=A0A5P2XR46_STRST|nr:hypothetical protein CP982_26820 [Streptomyces spectabilis]
MGYDRNTLVNFGLVKPVAGYHDVVVHGNGRGFFEPGRVNEAGVGFSLGDVHPSHIAEAIRNNPSYSGGAVRLVSCHTAWLHGNEVVDLPRGAAGPLRAAEEGARVGDPALHHPAAQEIANELGVPVMAPTHKVGVSPLRGPGQVPRIADNGYWRIFLPMAK